MEKVCRLYSAVRTSQVSRAATYLIRRASSRSRAISADQSAEELKSLIEAKLAGQTAEALEPRAILSLLDALKESVQVGNGKKTSSPVKDKASRKRARRTA